MALPFLAMDGAEELHTVQKQAFDRFLQDNKQRLLKKAEAGESCERFTEGEYPGQGQALTSHLWDKGYRAEYSKARAWPWGITPASILVCWRGN